MTEPIPEEIKGYKCPSLEDCSKCKFYKTDCIIFSKKGKQIKDKFYKDKQKE